MHFFLYSRASVGEAASGLAGPENPTPDWRGQADGPRLGCLSDPEALKTQPQLLSLLF